MDKKEIVDGMKNECRELHDKLQGILHGNYKHRTILVVFTSIIGDIIEEIKPTQRAYEAVINMLKERLEMTKEKGDRKWS